jgi:NAD(P)-dependent dehydrogenase (short-subunit alcohol dehydrogenase family)
MRCAAKAAQLRHPHEDRDIVEIEHVDNLPWPGKRFHIIPSNQVVITGSDFTSRSLLPSLENPMKTQSTGIFIGKSFVDFPTEDYRKPQSINVDGFLFRTQRVVREMLAQGMGGSIVSITSPLTNSPIVGSVPTVAMITKGGVEAGSPNLAMECAAQGNRVNLVAPGIFDTPMHTNDPTDVLATMSSIQDVSSVEEIVDAAVFVTEAPRVTGETVRVDGGGHLGKW